MQGRLEQAARYCRKALQLWLEHGDRHGAAKTLGQLGKVAEEQGRFDEAAGYYRQALDIFVEYSDQENAARVHHQLGNVAATQNRLDEAEDNYRQSLALKLAHGNRHGAATTYHALGNLMRQTGQYAESLDYYFSALPILAEAGDGGHLASIALTNLARLWRAWGDDVVVARTAEVMGQPPAEIRALFEQVAPDYPTAP